MIHTFSDYISKYVRASGLGERPKPGEHHFVSAYLVPKLHSLTGVVPDYINPDGTKGILGDVVYYRDERHHFGIEVKLGVVRLTKREFNEWIVGTTAQAWPDLFIGVGHDGVALSDWATFRDAYILSVRERYSDWSPVKISDGYGPMKNIDQLQQYFDNSTWFPFSGSPQGSLQVESEFTYSLSRLMGVNHHIGPDQTASGLVSHPDR